MYLKFPFLPIFCCLLLLPSLQLLAGTSAHVKSSINRTETPEKIQENLILPYIFSSESMGINIGIGGLMSGFYQEQMSIGGTIFQGDVSQGGGLGLWNYQLPNTQRFFLSVYAVRGYYPDQRAYAGGTLSYFPKNIPLPGSNDSNKTQVRQANGSSDWFDIKLEYALPIGATKNKGLVAYHTKNGLLVSKPSGGDEWNPLSSGATVLVARQFNRYQSFELPDGVIDGTIHAFELGVLYDNTDFPLNPSTGSKQYFSVSYDAAWLDSDKKWSFIELDISKYFSLGESEYAHQRILALNFWTGYSPSWQLDYNETGDRKITNNAPYNEGSTLGGFYRMRGFDQNRFHDKAAIYASAEYRYTLKYNPIADVNWLKFLKLDWIQLVGFIEAGRVGSSYNANELLTELKLDYGFSLRTLTAGLVLRVDVASSKEGTNTWVMVDHPF